MSSATQRYFDELQRRYEAYIANLREQEVPLVEYPCPGQACGRTLHTRQPTPDYGPTHTGATCPYCRAFYFLVVFPTGRTRTELIGTKLIGTTVPEGGGA